MAAAGSARMSALIQRHHPETPRQVIVPGRIPRRWRLTETTVVEATINGRPAGRRSLKRWDAERWFIDLPEKACRAAGVETGDRVTLEIRIASADLPDELERLLATSAEARRRWRQLSASRQRMIREHVLAARRSETRARRARTALAACPEPRR